MSDGDDMGAPRVDGESSSDEDDTGLELATRGLRTVSATYTGYEEVSDEDCKVADEAPPAHEHQCGYCDTPDHLNEKCTDGKPPPKRPGTCEVDGCGDHGECIDAKCSCDTGYYGRACEVQGCMGDECECCASGVYDHAGACCDAMDSHMLPHLDKDGACCYKSALDACGVCGGDGVVVAKDGTCCSVRCPPALLRPAPMRAAALSCICGGCVLTHSGRAAGRWRAPRWSRRVLPRRQDHRQMRRLRRRE